MKTNLLFTLGLSLFTSLAALANTPANDNRTPGDEADVLATVTTTHFVSKAYISTAHPRMLNVIVRKAGCDAVDLTLRDNDGHVLYETLIKEDAVRKPLNLRLLEPGTYTVELRRGNQVETNSFEVK